MTDRELLELAAKAAGLRHVDYSGTDYDGRLGIVLVDEVGRHCSDWSPLLDKGDAIELAVMLHINIRFSWDGCDDQYDEVWAEKGRVSCCEQIGMLPNGHEFNSTEATCRAITRTAAELGKAMK